MKRFIVPILFVMMQPAQAEIGTISAGVIAVATVSETGQCFVDGEPVECGLPVNDNQDKKTYDTKDAVVEIAQWRRIKE